MYRYVLNLRKQHFTEPSVECAFGSEIHVGRPNDFGEDPPVNFDLLDINSFSRENTATITEATDTSACELEQVVGQFGNIRFRPAVKQPSANQRETCRDISTDENVPGFLDEECECVPLVRQTCDSINYRRNIPQDHWGIDYRLSAGVANTGLLEDPPQRQNTGLPRENVPLDEVDPATGLLDDPPERHNVGPVKILSIVSIV
jgi:hypothetical protein